MLFNAYIWGLYTQSEQGQTAIVKFSTVSSTTLEELFGLGEYFWQLAGDDEQFWGRNELRFNLSGLIDAFAAKREINDWESAKLLYGELLEAGIPLLHTTAADVELGFGCWGKGAEGGTDWVRIIEEMSFGLYLAHPAFFLPYLFQNKFYQFQKLCEAFEIPLPPVPGKRDLKVRLFYYFQINQAIQEFRQLHGLSPAEMCAFLYDFAPNTLMKQDAELPEPSKVWLITGGAGDNGDFYFLDNSTPDSTSHWQGNIDTRRGDILLMYCISPRSYIHSIWRATTDGFHDPFFFYHSTIWISSPIRTVPVTFKEMKEHPLLSQKGAIRAHFQGPSGKAFTVQEYQAVLEIMTNKGQDISLLPKIRQTTFLPDAELVSERDVELKLIEPFLRSIGYSETDWIRQMPVSMGRGERNYPDYVFSAMTKKGEEKAQMLLESKFRIRTRRELTAAYYQAKSYALRLQAQIMAVAAIEGIWIFKDKNGFSMDNVVYKDWKELENPDLLHEIRKLMGK